MIRGGDELSQTKNGNNNTYNQDNELTHLNWDLGDEQRKKFLEFCRLCARIWREHREVRNYRRAMSNREALLRLAGAPPEWT